MGIVLLAALLGIGSPLLQEGTGAAGEEEGPQGCRRCDHRGVTDCEEHDEELAPLEAGVLCTVAAACEDCGGSLLLDCEDCEGGPESALLEARRTEQAAWLERGHELDEFLGRPVMRVEGPRIHLAGLVEELDGVREGGGHRFFHFVVRDAERVADLAHGHYGLEERRGYRGPMRLWFWEEMDDHARVMHDFLHAGSTGDFKLLGRRPLFSVCTTDPVFENDFDTLHSLGVHNAAHMLLSNMIHEIWVGDQGAGWFDAGSAHWYEERVFGLLRHYCVDEAPTPYDWNGGLWRAAVRKELRRDDDVLLPTLLRKQTGQLRDYEHAYSFALYDWLVRTRPEALHPILMGLKKRTHPRELFGEHLGMNLIEAEEAWRAWVQDEYPAREKRRR